jgi:hypothetical protein
MAQKQRSILKNYFLTGSRPTKDDFEDLVDSCVNIVDDKATDTEALNSDNNEKFLTPKTGRLLVNPLLATKEPSIAGGTVTDFWAGNKTFLDLATKVRDSLLTGVVFTSDAAILAGDKIIVAFGKLQAQINGIKANYRLKTQYINAVGNHTLTTSTTLQKLFNSPSGGAFTLVAGKKYKFKCNFGLSGMNTGSGDFSFGFLGTATLTSIRYDAISVKGGSPGQPEFVTATDKTATPLVTQSAGTTTGRSVITGIINCNAAGTIIPAVALSLGIAATVNGNSYFEIEEIGNASDVSNGAWV